MTVDDADEGKESPDEDVGVRDRVADERQSSVKAIAVQADGGENDTGRRDLNAQKILQPQQQRQETLVGWERFLHIRSIKVLLVENDDSTRHVVTALLRNCNYEVIEAANGVQAWKVLQDLTNQVDLVLTEVAMPCLSGIGLLCKIMSHRTRKNIPVIMMSTHDSMGLVFKCLSKGAVDVLVKPIRKNELKNLWQHVWRRCHSSSGSGSESGAQTQKSVHKKSGEKSEDSSSNCGENNGSNGLNNVDGSDDGSGAQSSWTKQPLEEDSSQALSPACQLAKTTHSKCNQLDAETSCNKKLHIAVKKEGQEDEESGYKDPLPDTTNILDSEPGCPIDILASVAGANQNNTQEAPSSSSSSKLNKGENPNGKLRPKKHSVINIGSCDPQIKGREFEPPRELTSVLEMKNNPLDNPRETTIELSLKRLRSIQGPEMIQDNTSLLKHSENSAFSRYNTSSSAAKAPKGIMGSSNMIDDSLDVAEKDSMSGHTNANPVFPASKMNTAQQATQLKLIDMQASSASSPTRDIQLELQTQQLNRPHHQQHYHHFHNLEQEQNVSIYGQSSRKKLNVNAHCGFSNTSASGSNYGSNGQNGSSTAVGAELANVEIGGLGGRNGGADANGSGFGNRVYENKFAQREAALLKFRQKRKERCFKKKIRYQNRKRLAEQRPRVRGQFVRQADHNNSNERAAEE